MTQAEFLGARLDKNIMNMVEETAREENIDKTKALKELIFLGRREYLIKKYLNLYREGRCSIDKSAEKVGITVNEMMKEVSNAGIKSEETIEEYKEGLRLLR